MRRLNGLFQYEFTDEIFGEVIAEYDRDGLVSILTPDPDTLTEAQNDYLWEKGEAHVDEALADYASTAGDLLYDRMRDDEVIDL